LQPVLLRTQQTEQDEVQRDPADRGELGTGELKHLGDQQRHQHRQLEQPHRPDPVAAAQPDRSAHREHRRQRTADRNPDHRYVGQQVPAVEADPDRDQRGCHGLDGEYRDRDAGCPRVQREPVEPALQRRPQRVHRRCQLDLVARRRGQQRPDLGTARDVRPGRTYLLRRLRQPAPGQPAGHALDRVVDGVRQVLARVDRAAVGEELHTEHQQHERDVHDRGGRAVEVVVVRGDELADLVDEQPEPDPADERRGRPDHRSDVGQQQHDRHQHQQSARQHVRDVQTAAADLRVTHQP